MEITPKAKDIVLDHLCLNCIPEQSSSGNTSSLLTELNLDFDSFNAIMNQFERFGFIEDLNLRTDSVHFVFLLDALDYKGRGGFTFQEEVLEANLNKLILELEIIEKQLMPKHLDTADKIGSILSALVSGYSLFKK